jgi:DNA modification methylase
MIITDTPTDSIQPYDRNPRINSKSVDAVARSIQEFGFRQPIVVDDAGIIIVGHTRWKAAKSLGMETVPVHVATGMTPEKIRTYRIADNKTAELSDWDMDILPSELSALREMDIDLNAIGFSDEELEKILGAGIHGNDGITDPDAVPEPPDDAITQPGDIWILGKHRLMCGDSTNQNDARKLMSGAKAQLIHSDPPYGMGKESDGVTNDNLYGEALDAFQMKWWATFREFLTDNASAYIWGIAQNLWRLWYCSGLGDSEKLELRNQIVWDKKNIPGMKSGLLTQYAISSEHCLFFQLGDQFRGNINTDDFPEDWEAVRAYLSSESDAAAITPSDITRVCGVGMYGHWFTKSQFTLIPEKHYKSLASEYHGRFTRPWTEINRQFDKVKFALRSYFDNTHDIMRDVWDFSRVTGDERYGHATPKPVAMIERIIKSSLPQGGLCVEPFGGSGSTLIAAEKTGRICYTMEIQGRFCDVIVQRWENYSGQKAHRGSP